MGAEPAASRDHIGRSIRRVEDRRLLRGEDTFAGDIRLPDLAAVAVVRSPLAHAVLLGVDLAAARAAEGVLDAFWHEDVVEFMGPLPTARPFDPDLDRFRQSPLPRDRVRYAGEPVAVVVAETRALAEDAAALVTLDLDPLDAAVDASNVEGPELFDGHPNLIHTIVKAAGGDIGLALEGADVVVEETLRVHRYSAVPLETRGLVARPDPDGGLTLWGVTKLPHFLRSGIAETLGLDPSLVRVVPVAVGGGFGVRGEFYPEDVLVPVAALRTGRPVAWIEDRREHLLGTNHSRESSWRIRAGATGDGDLVGLEAQLVYDLGGYLRTLVPPELAASDLIGPYRLPSFRSEVRCVLTNKMGIGPVRSPGMYEAWFARERVLDRLAERLGMKAIDFRMRNLLRPEEFPHRAGLQVFGTEVVFDSADPPEALRIAAEAVTRPMPAPAPGRRLGRAAIPFIEHTAAGPVEIARLRVEPPGMVAVYVGTTSMGQGHETTLAQIAADAVGVPFDRVAIREGDPDATPFGLGTFASRSTVMGGSAVWLAGLELRARLDRVDPGRRLPLERVLQRAAAEGLELEVVHRFEAEHMTYSYGAHGAVVELDPELGTLQVLRYVVVADVGRVVNPDIVLGQIRGGAVQGMGGALLEELAYSPDGQPLSTSFMDYLLPTALDVPEVEVVLLDRARSTTNPLGVKGAGELGSIAVGATLASAAQDALGPNGGWIDRLPLAPELLSRAARWGDEGQGPRESESASA
jgi:aerobic carbon-monoxide dehydrogenase large subunit